MGRYIIKIWETEDDREQGLSDIIETNLSDIQVAIKRAKDLNAKQNYNSMEVQDTKQKITYYSHTPDGEQSYYEEINKAEKQEKINKYAELVYNKKLQDRNEEIYGKAKDVIKKLKEDREYINNPKNEMDKYYIDMVNEEIKPLIEEIENDFDEEDYIYLFEHPMSSFLVVSKELDDFLETLMEEFKDKIYESELNKIDIKSVVEYYFDENEITNLMTYGSDRDSYNMPTHSQMYEDILDMLKIEYQSISTDDVSDGKYTTTIEFDDNNSVTIDLNAGNGVQEVTDNVESIKEEYIKFQTNLEKERLEKLKNLDLNEVVGNHYDFNDFEKILKPDFNTLNRKKIFAEMYEKILKRIGIDIAYVTIDELNKSKYKTTVMFPNGYTDYYYSNDLCSRKTAIKNIENMRNSYIKMQQEMEQNEQDMEME